VLLKHATREGFDKFVPEIQEMILRRPCERSPYEHQIASLASRQFDVQPEKLPEWLDDDAEAERQELRKRLATFDFIKPDPLPTQLFVISDVALKAPPNFIAGDSAKTPIEPGFPKVLHDGPVEIEPLPVALQSTGRRSALARWIVDPTNPLTARVMVNRIWQQHFGRGLVETASDFGHLGSAPTHPELLDWLASRFIEDGWSLKKLHRRILTSSTYRQSSQRPMDERLQAIDPANTLLWRMNPRRLSGEEINDAILTASGELQNVGRAIYKPVKRNAPDELLALFDFPDRIISCDLRHRTTTSRQALVLLNGDWLQKRAGAVASLLRDLNDNQFVEEVYLRLYGRRPTVEEQALACSFCESNGAVGAQSVQESIYQNNVRGHSVSPTDWQARPALVHALLISNEMIYVD
jgi:hypothetical protein